MPEVRRRRRSRPVRLLRRLRRQRPLMVGLGAAAALFIGWVLWAMWLAWATSDDLADVREKGTVMRAALVRGDAEGARDAMEAYQDAASSAESRTSGVTWWLFEKAPLLGDDAEGVAVVAEVLADIGRDGLPPVADAADEVTADAFQPADGVFPLDRIAAMEEPAQQSEEAFDVAAGKLQTVDPSGFVGPVRHQFNQLRTLVTDARKTLGSTYRAARLMPAMMGQEQPRYYLLVLQNNAELRSGGGLPGALSLVEMRDGRARIVEQADMSEIGRSADPVELTPEERRLFGRILGLAGVNATLTPDLARSAEIIRARWEQEIGGRLDGMFFVDPVAVSYLLRGTGPVAVPGYPRPVHAGNVVAAVENAIYRASNDRKVHSDYQRAVAKAVFDVFADGRGNTAESIRGLVAGVMEGRVRMHSFHPDEQAEIAGTEIAGEFPREPGDQPGVGIYLNDGGPTKLQYYLRYAARAFSRSCVGDRQDIAGSIDLHSDTPDDVDRLPPSITGEGFPGLRVDPGDQLLVLYLTSPIGGELVELTIDGQRVRRPAVQEFAGREVATVGVHLDPQERREIRFVMRSGPGQSGDVDLEVTPGAFPGSSNATSPSACEVR